MRRQNIASYGFCFNCGCAKPDHSAISCPQPPGCAYCPSYHLSLLHREVTTNQSRRYPRDIRDRNINNQTSGNVSVAKTEVPVQVAEPPLGNKPPTSITSAGANTTKTQVSLNRSSSSEFHNLVSASPSSRQPAQAWKASHCSAMLLLNLRAPR